MSDSTTRTHSEADLRLDDKYRNWSPQSQTYASADILLQYVATGWEIENPAACETFFVAGARRAEVYRFNLRRAGERLELPVLANPMVFRLIEKYRLNVIRIHSDRGDAI